MKRATLLLALLAAGCSSSPTFSPGSSNGGVGVQTSGSTTSTTSSGSGSGSSSGGSSSGSTGAPAGGSMAANLSFSPQTVVYHQPSSTQLVVTAYEHAYACTQLATASGQYAQLSLAAGGASISDAGQFLVGNPDGGPIAAFVEGALSGDGGTQVFFTANSGYAQLTNAPPSSPLNGNFSVNGGGSGGINTVGGSFAAISCP